MSKRSQKRLFRLVDEIAALSTERTRVLAELEMHSALNDDAQRDAAIGNYIDREEAGVTNADVKRFQRAVADIDRRLLKLEAERSRLSQGLGLV